MKSNILTMAAAICMLAAMEGKAQNPIIQTRYTSDPAPVVHGDTLYLYTGIDNEDGEGYQKTFWQLYTTTDMVNWTDRGKVASLEDFNWAGDNGAWASQVIERNDKWYMYAPIQLRGIGVLVGKSPYGPWNDPLKRPIINKDIYDIDPTVFIDDDGQAYLYWGNNGLWYVELTRNMLDYNGGIVEVPLTEEAFGGYKETYVDDNGVEQTRVIGVDCYEEGPWVYKREGKYYLVYAAGGVPEHLSYSMSDSPTGPWKYQGKIMDTPEGSFTTHPGVVDFKGNSYIFYHSGQLKGGSGFRRSVCVEQFEYNADGTIPEIPMTKKGVTTAVSHLSPYERREAETIAMSIGIRTDQNEERGVYLDSLDHGDYVKVKSLDFGEEGAKSVMVCARKKANAGRIEVCIDSQSNAVATIDVSEATDWTELTADLDETVTGVHDVYFRFRATDTSNREELMQFDYWQFAPNATGVESIATDRKAGYKSGMYDLSGRRIHRPVKGIYIKDGKKYLK